MFLSTDSGLTGESRTKKTHVSKQKYKGFVVQFYQLQKNYIIPSQQSSLNYSTVHYVSKDRGGFAHHVALNSLQSADGPQSG